VLSGYGQSATHSNQASATETSLTSQVRTGVGVQARMGLSGRLGCGGDVQALSRGQCAEGQSADWPVGQAGMGL
jgi:hypothetical protein